MLVGVSYHTVYILSAAAGEDGGMDTQSAA